MATRKMESRTARMDIVGIGDPDTAKEGATVKKMVAGIYLRTEKPAWADSQVHTFRDEKSGSLFGVWGSAAINRGLSTIPKGTYCELEFTGKMIPLEDGRTMKEIDVRVPEGTKMVDAAQDVAF